MKNGKDILAVLLSTIWISTSEFLRNQLLFASYWTEHYQQMGLQFPASPINGAIWGIWSLLLALLIRFIASKFSIMQTIGISWLAGFVMMWLVIGNLNVLPMGILTFAIPWSLFECGGAAWIIFRLVNPHAHRT